MKSKLLLTAFVLYTVLVNADAQYSGTCGEHVTWRINGDTLYIEGFGEMSDYDYYGTSPWSDRHDCDIRYIYIQAGVTYIGKYAFSNMYGGFSVTIPNTITTIGNYAFAVNYINEINIPNSVTTIGKYAFNLCQFYSYSIDIPSSVILIDTGAFRDCTGLSQFNVAADNPNYSSPNGLLCNKEQTILIQCLLPECEFILPNTITTIGRYAFVGCYYHNITIPNSVSTIEDYAFSRCTSLQNINIPNSVTSIGNYLFSGCSQLLSINVAADNPIYSSVSGVLFNKEQNTLVAYPPGKAGAYLVPNGVTTIANYAFNECEKLMVIDISNSVTSIGVQAFSWCGNLSSATIGSSVTSIGDGAFFFCVSLTSVTNYAATPQTIDNNVFYSVNKSACTLYVPKGSLSAYKAADVWKEFGKIIGIDVPEGIHNVSSDHIQSTKIIRDGQIFILRGERVYTLQGQEVE